MSSQSLTDFETPSKNHYRDYAKILGTEDERIDLVFDVLDSLETMFERKRVRELAMEWDEIGVKLKDGKVILPPGMEEITNEIIKENQICSLFLPQEMGGLGLTNVHSGPIIELLAKYDFSLKILSLSGVGIMNLLVRYYKPEFDNALQGFVKGDNIGYVCFSEPQAGSNLRNIKATSELVGDEYVLNGTKIWISNGGYGNCGLFLANNIVDGKPAGTNVFLVEGKDGITTLRLEKKSGLRASPTAHLLFENVTVPKENLVGPLGEGYEKVLERLMGMRVAVAFQALGACKRALELSWDYGNTREQFGRPIIQFGAVNDKINWMKSQIPKIEEYAYQCAYALDYNNSKVKPEMRAIEDKKRLGFVNSIQDGVNNHLVHYYVSGAKLYCSEVSNYLLYDASQVFGGMGFVSEMEVNKITRDVRVLPIFDGTSEIHNFVITRSQQVIENIPDFKRPMDYFDYTTIYDEFLYAKFPNLQNDI